jgi:20S proteasome subunit alpha 7
VRESVYFMSKMLHKTHDEAKDKTFELDISWICSESDFKTAFIPGEFLAEQENKAKQDLEDEEMRD